MIYSFQNYIKWGFESRLKLVKLIRRIIGYYIKWGFESRLKLVIHTLRHTFDYIKWGFESRLKHLLNNKQLQLIISNGDLRVD